MEYSGIIGGRGSGEEILKGHVALDRASWYKKRLKPFVTKCIMVKKMFQ